MLAGLENPVHILMLLAVVMLLFGAKRLPEMGRMLGSGLREFKVGVTGTTPAARRDAETPSEQLTAGS
jgi:sec-independent protein translocase protein TatA